MILAIYIVQGHIFKTQWFNVLVNES
jgi:hypothetical protein